MYHQLSGENTVRGGGSRSSRRGKRSTSSGQTVLYPFCSYEHEVIRCILFIHANASMILFDVAGSVAPVVSVSCAYTLGDILAGNGCDVFEPDARCRHLPNAKAHLPGFYIDLYIDHSFTNTSGVQYIEPAGSYLAQFRCTMVKVALPWTRYRRGQRTCHHVSLSPTPLPTTAYRLCSNPSSRRGSTSFKATIAPWAVAGSPMRDLPLLARLCATCTR